jgi:hypothetical protein
VKTSTDQEERMRAFSIKMLTGTEATLSSEILAALRRNLQGSALLKDEEGSRGP